jgi:hypothetical protein
MNLTKLKKYINNYQFLINKNEFFNGAIEEADDRYKPKNLRKKKYFNTKGEFSKSFIKQIYI